MLNKCKINDDEVFFFGEEKDLDFPEYLKIETLEKDTKITPKDEKLTIFSAKDFAMRMFSHKRTSDIRLFEDGINSFADLKAAHFLIQYKTFNGSKSIRDLIENKYSEVVSYYDNSETSSGSTAAVGSTSD